MCFLVVLYIFFVLICLLSYRPRCCSHLQPQCSEQKICGKALRQRRPWRLRREGACLQRGRSSFDPWVGKIPWRRKWQPTPVLLPRKFHGQRSLVGYSPWGCKESDTTEQLHFYFHSIKKGMKMNKQRNECSHFSSSGNSRITHDQPLSFLASTSVNTCIKVSAQPARSSPLHLCAVLYII